MKEKGFVAVVIIILIRMVGNVRFVEKLTMKAIPIVQSVDLKIFKLNISLHINYFEANEEVSDSVHHFMVGMKIILSERE